MFTSRRLRQEFPDLARHCRRANKPRSGPYSAGTVGGAPLSVVKQYIEQQNHRTGLCEHHPAPPGKPSRRSAPRAVDTRRPARPTRNPLRSASPRQDALHPSG
ncbi:transposase [Streptomyces blastmyceticus]|uniref:transposase n=1 Tax=Streptomyces blastmyceticus TaxID=68180 RepID=UPI0031D72837